MQRPFLGFWPERKRMEKRRVEILAPAGSYESMVAAVNAGANAVYIGGSRFEPGPMQIIWMRRQ